VGALTLSNDRRHRPLKLGDDGHLGGHEFVVLKSDETFLLWLNAFEYHKDEDKQNTVAELHALILFETLRAMFVSMVDRAHASLGVADFIRFLSEAKPDGSKPFGL
jgi:hypothetical protein